MTDLLFTTSWDDGDTLDMRVAELLDRYGMAGTFYLSKTYRKVPLSSEQIRNLSARHEVGAHTLSHPDLRTLSDDELRREIFGSKAWLEEIIGKEVPSFCYPSGRYDERVTQVVKDAGFRSARTTELGVIDRPKDPLRMGTTMHVYPFPFRKKDGAHFYWRYLFQPWRQRSGELHALGVPLWALRSWQSAARAAFDIALKRGGAFHLWGHSWEIDRYDMWGELESFLAWVSKQGNCQHVTNGELISERRS